MFAHDERQIESWRGLISGLSTLELNLLKVIARGEHPLGQEALQTLASSTKGKPTISKIRSALSRLKVAGIIAKPAGTYRLVEILFSDYLLEKNIPQG